MYYGYWILIFIVIAVIAVISIVFVLDSENKKEPVSPPSNECTKPLSELPSVGSLKCCFIGGEPTAYRFLESINMTIGPVPTYYLDACRGFCEDGEFDKTTLTCKKGNSVAFQICVDRIKPTDCDGVAFPVGADGIQLYYAHSATDEECKDRRVCVPAGILA